MTATPSPDALVDAMPFARSIGVAIVEASPRRVTGHLEWHPERCTVGDVLHGGALMTLADSTGAVCAFFNLPSGATTSTLDSSTNFLRAVRGGVVRAVSEPIHAGRTTIVVRTELFDDDNRLVGHVVQTQAVRTPDAAQSTG